MTASTTTLAFATAATSSPTPRDATACKPSFRRNTPGARGISTSRYRRPASAFSPRSSTSGTSPATAATVSTARTWRCAWPAKAPERERSISSSKSEAARVRNEAIRIVESASQKRGIHALIRSRTQEMRRDAAQRREGEKAGGAALSQLSAHHHRGFLRHLDRGGAAQDQGGREAHRPQGRAHLEGDAGLLADQRARLRAFARLHDNRRRREGAALELLRPARRGRARLYPGQAPERAGRRAHRGVARDRVRDTGDGDRGRAHRESTKNFRHG